MPSLNVLYKLMALDYRVFVRFENFAGTLIISAIFMNYIMMTRHFRWLLGYRFSFELEKYDPIRKIRRTSFSGSRSNSILSSSPAACSSTMWNPQNDRPFIWQQTNTVTGFLPSIAYWKRSPNSATSPFETVFSAKFWKAKNEISLEFLPRKPTQRSNRG